MRKSKNKTILSSTTVLVLSIVVGIIVWLPQLINDISSLNAWITNLVGLAITILSGAFIFLKNREIRFLKHETLFPFLFILLFIGIAQTGQVYPKNIQFNVGYVGLICTSTAFYRLIYQSNKFMDPWHTMESMMLLSAGSLFMPILWVFIPIFWLGMEVFNKSSFRCIFSSFMGLITPYILSLGVIYLMEAEDVICEFYEAIKSAYTISLPNNLYAWAGLIIFFISSIIGASSLFNQHDDRRYTHWINNFGGIILLVSIILNFLFYNDGILNITTAFWATFLITSYYSNSNNLFSKIFFWLLLIISLGIIVLA